MISFSPNTSKRAIAHFSAAIFAAMPLDEINNEKIRLEVKYWRDKYSSEDKVALIKFLADRFFAEMLEWAYKNQYYEVTFDKIVEKTS